MPQCCEKISTKGKMRRCHKRTKKGIKFCYIHKLTFRFPDIGTCCFCGDACNPCSQACGRCVRNGNMYRGLYY